MKQVPVRSARGGMTISTSISSGARAVVNIPWKNSSAAIQRSPSGGGSGAQWGTQSDGEDGELGGRIGVHQAASDGPAVADLRMGDKGDGFGQEGGGRGHARGGIERSLAGAGG